MLIFEIALFLGPYLLILGIGGAIAEALFRIPCINRWFTSVFNSLPMGRSEVQKLSREERSDSHV